VLSVWRRTAWQRRLRPPWAGLALALAAVAVAWLPWPLTAPAPAERHLHVTAGDFAYSPSSLQVNPGDRVTIELASSDVVHGLYLDGYALDLSADPGRPASVTFVADRPGAFRFRCSVTCGALHPFMIGRLVVGSSDLFWRAAGLALLAALAGLVWARR
jgi:heme/copper-type cytochrome/quinol oxidase subunit 2